MAVNILPGRGGADPRRPAGRAAIGRPCAANVTIERRLIGDPDDGTGPAGQPVRCLLQWRSRGGVQVSEGPGPEPEQQPGGMRFQDENTTPREPTLAERKAREQAEKR